MTNHVTSTTADLARVLVCLSKKAFIDGATMLRKMAQLNSSARRGRFMEDVKTETLQQLREAYENNWKLFLFSLINASNGLYSASQVIEAGPEGLLSEKEKKKFAAVVKSKKESKLTQLKKTSYNLGIDKSRSICFRCKGSFQKKQQRNIWNFPYVG